ncbi:hypothetical protein ACIP23_14340 [Streptomyces sp. NPDC089733]
MQNGFDAAGRWTGAIRPGALRFGDRRGPGDLTADTGLTADTALAT